MQNRTETRFHAAELRSVSIQKEKSDAHLMFVAENSDEYNVIVRSCKILRVTDFIPQNVVSRLILCSGSDEDLINVEEKIVWATIRVGSGSTIKPDVLSRLAHDISAEKLQMLYLESSWGLIWLLSVTALNLKYRYQIFCIGG